MAFPLCAITASVAAFPSPSGIAAKYPSCSTVVLVSFMEITCVRNFTVAAYCLL
jgi:hypothetical protein